PPPDTIHQTAVLQTNFNNSKFAENFQNRSQQPLPPNTKNLLKPKLFSSLASSPPLHAIIPLYLF
ncbi:hypothetical protein, partial [Neisseria iguanae]|uniref:hypothetical protein n=1 Tax=Neisseria iguanae TaxID=90242 RepID=UPI001B809798